VVATDAAGPTARDPDLEAVAAARRGDGSAFGVLVARHEKRVYRLACRILSDPDAALDAAQETFVRAWRALATFEGASRFTTWLTRIAINQCRNELRRRRTRKHGRPMSLDEPLPGTDATRAEAIADRGASAFEQLRAREVAEALERAMASLDPDEREVLVLREVEDLSYEAMAEILDVAVGTVRSRLHRARATLARRMAAAERPGA
jgi:RNA polymerase sigma-70 factor (ECF subfamily)